MAISSASEILQQQLSRRVPGVNLPPRPPFPPMRQAKGLEKLILSLTVFVVNAQNSAVKTLYGKYEIQGDQTKSKLQKAFDKGLIYVLSKIAGIDFCKIVRFGLNSLNIGSAFDPTKRPENPTTFENLKWEIQYKAFQTQTLIDDFYGAFGTDLGQDARVGLKELILSINKNLDELTNAETGLSNKDILDSFPITSIFLNTINEGISFLTRYLNIRNISQEDVQNVIKFIDDTREVMIAIQRLNTPANIINVTDRLTGGYIDDKITELEEFISSRGEPLRFIKYLLERAKSLNATGKSVLGYINLARTIIKLLLFLIKAFYVIRFLISGNPAPAAGVNIAVISKGEDVKFQVIDKRGIENFESRLQQIEDLLRECAELVNILLASSYEVIAKLNLIKLNLESCNPKLAQEIENIVQETSQNAIQYRSFLDSLNNAVNKNDTTFGKYNIFIVNEEVVDEGISLRRRYGIAKDPNNFIVVQTTPTFASLDQIIINEVKFLLLSKGLVKSEISGIPLEQVITYENALGLLGDDKIEFDLNDLNINNVDVESQKDISSFLDALPGGAAFRKRSRSRIIAHNEKLLKTLKSNDPNSKYIDSITKSTQESTNKLKIEKLQDEKKALQASVAVAATSPVTALGIPKIIEKIKKIDAEIETLKKS